jgi:hypothetical protein
VAVALVALAGGRRGAMVRAPCTCPRGGLGDEPAGFLGRASALVALSAVLYALGWRAVRTAPCRTRTPYPTTATLAGGAFWRGLPGTWWSSPGVRRARRRHALLSFFR